MPKEMFFHIKEEKRKKFIEASIEEFTTKSFEQVSVNSIVRKANVARGSFYNYFESLEELFNYIFQSIRKERLIYGKQLIKEGERNYFTFMKKLFAYDYDLYNEKGHYSLFRNYIHFVQFIQKGSLKKELTLSSLQDGNTDIYDIGKMFNYQQYGVTIEEFTDIIEIVMLIMINTFLKSDSENLNKEEIISLFNRRISILEKGLDKGELK